MYVYNKYSSVERVKESREERERGPSGRKEGERKHYRIPSLFFDLFAFSRHLCRMDVERERKREVRVAKSNRKGDVASLTILKPSSSTIF